MNSTLEKKLFLKIKEGDEKAFETLFHFYYAYLCHYAASLVGNDAAAEEIVQDFFVKFWEKRKEISITSSVKNYLFRSVKNQCLNYLQHNKIKNRFAQETVKELRTKSVDEDNYIEIDLAQKIEDSIESLPEKRKEIFKLSREKGLKYREIAEKLNISIKTVETHMGLAIKTLREKLSDYKSFFLLL
jgi:RNA polymerase sigma-70 factor (ECF subfamily)